MSDLQLFGYLYLLVGVLYTMYLWLCRLASNKAGGSLLTEIVGFVLIITLWPAFFAARSVIK